MPNKNLTACANLTTPRLTLSQISIDDHKEIFSLRSDAEINKYLDRQPAATIEDAINFIDKVTANIENNNSMYWVIKLTAPATFVGTVCIYGFSGDRESCEIGYEQLKKFWGQGLMTEAIEAVIKYVFGTLKFKRIIAFTHPENEGSSRILSKLNFQRSEEKDPENSHLEMFTAINTT